MIFANITWRIGAIIAAALAGLLLIGFATQTIRIEGLKIWPISIEGFKSENVRIRLDLDAIKPAQEMARIKAEAAKARIEAEYKAKAERADNEYQKQLASANSRADAYARRMRVKAPKGGSGGTVAAPNGDVPPSDNGPGEDAFVAVSQSDFDILNENTVRLVKAREWALGLNGE